jgi:hypothetical protein
MSLLQPSGCKTQSSRSARRSTHRSRAVRGKLDRCRSVKSRGARVTTAVSADEALSLLEEERPDLRSNHSPGGIELNFVGRTS